MPTPLSTRLVPKMNLIIYVLLWMRTSWKDSKIHNGEQSNEEGNVSVAFEALDN